MQACGAQAFVCHGQKECESQQNWALIIFPKSRNMRGSALCKVCHQRVYTEVLYGCLHCLQFFVTPKILTGSSGLLWVLTTARRDRYVVWSINFDAERSFFSPFKCLDIERALLPGAMCKNLTFKSETEESKALPREYVVANLPACLKCVWGERYNHNCFPSVVSTAVRISVRLGV